MLASNKIWEPEFEGLLVRAEIKHYYNHLKFGRGKETSKLTEFGRNIDLLGKEIWKSYRWGRESSIP